MFGLTNVLRNRLGDDLAHVSADNFGSSVQIPGGNVSVPLGKNSKFLLQTKNVIKVSN